MAERERKPPGPTNLCSIPISLIVEFLVAALLDSRPMSLQKSIKSYSQVIV
jgi:hypothetical protein